METTEKIVEAYVRYVKRWATIPNIKCKGGYEIDLLAIDPMHPKTGKYHIECHVATSAGFKKLKAGRFDAEKHNVPQQKAIERNKLDFFVKRKFTGKAILDELHEYGFSKGKYQRVIVAWDWDEDVQKKADKSKVALWKFPELLDGLKDAFKDKKAHFTDDTIRTIHLLTLAEKESTRKALRQDAAKSGKVTNKIVVREEV